jgi:glycosyltransferase involved in cell wall biosynthesis
MSSVQVLRTAEIVTEPVLSICSPVHNEEDNLPELARRITAALDDAGHGPWECILVDDGSTDASGRILNEICAADPRFRALHHDVNQGERAAWHTAFRHARGEVACIIAADLQSPPEELPKLVDVIIDEGFDVGTGRRVQRKDGLLYFIATWILTQFSRIAWKVDVRDVSSSFFGVRTKFLKELRLVENDHRYILAILKRRGASIKEINTSHFARSHGSSHYSRMKVLRAFPEVARFTLRLYRGYYD